MSTPKKKIGKGVILDIDLEGGTLGRLSCDCLNGSSITPTNYTFTIASGDEYAVNDPVLFVETSATQAENVVVIPSEGGCL